MKMAPCSTASSITRVEYENGAKLKLRATAMAATPPPPSPSMTPKPPPSSSTNFLLLLFLLLTIPSSLPTSASPSPPKISYTDHCNSIAPQSPPTSIFLNPSESFHISYGNYSGGHKLLSTDAESSPANPDYSNSGHFQFHTNYIHKTRSPDILQLGGILSFQGPQVRVRDPHPRRHQPGSLHSFVITNKYVHFELSGSWSESTGMICMVGTGSSNSLDGKSLYLSAVFKLNYPKVSTISTSLVHGTVYSLDPVESPNFFDNISVLAYAQNNYSYTQFPLSIKDSCSNLRVPKETRGFEMGSLGSYVPSLLSGSFGLEYGSDCNGETCHPFPLKSGSPPKFLSFHQIYCSEEGRLHMRIGISDFRPLWFYDPLDPENSLVAEGFWDHEKNHMCLVACPVLGNASVGECTIGLSLWFPMVLSIKDRSTVVGRIWSNRDKNDPGYFSIMSFRDFGGYMNLAPSMRYEYSPLDGSSRCDAIKNNSIISHKAYPDGRSKRDLSFSVSFNRGESAARGHAYPLSLGDTVFVDSFLEAPLSGVNDTLWKISYDISYSFYNSSSTASRNHKQISAEGLYNSKNGHACMVGCMKAKTENSMDCSILIHIQLAPMNPEKGEHLNGTVMSTRGKSDPLYFDPILLSSHIMYEEQAAKSIWRMDIEIIMVIVSLTLSCVFIRAQILYAKKSQGVLPSLSIIMLVVMTLGYLIPLILNSEALFIMIQNEQRSSFWPDEWMVVKEAVVRVLALVSFVLHLRFLQVAWSARSAAEGKRDLWVAEQKTLKLCLVLYSLGALVAWFVPSKSQAENLSSFAGFILDGFLFPQIMINFFRNSHEKALSLPFYVGMTIIRMFPHLYDLYRARLSLPYLHSSYIYASPEAGFYSSAWDIIIPLAGALFATSIFMQQRFGGSCILPPRFRKHGIYMTIDELDL